MKRMGGREVLRSLRHAAGAGQLLVLPPAPACCECGAPCCCCWVPGLQSAGPCTCGFRCDHSFDEDEFDLWVVECLNRMQLTGAVPETILVSAGPFLSPLARDAIEDATPECPLCGGELVGGWDRFNGVWVECVSAEAQPEAGHFVLLVKTL